MFFIYQFTEEIIDQGLMLISAGSAEIGAASAVRPVGRGRPWAGTKQNWKIEMNNIIWLEGAVVIGVVILGFLGLR